MKACYRKGIFLIMGMMLIMGSWVMNDIFAGQYNTIRRISALVGEDVGIRVGNGFYFLDEIQAFHIALYMLMLPAVVLIWFAVFDTELGGEKRR